MRLVAVRLARPARQGLPDLGDELLASPVRARLRVRRVIRQPVQHVGAHAKAGRVGDLAGHWERLAG